MRGRVWLLGPLIGLVVLGWMAIGSVPAARAGLASGGEEWSVNTLPAGAETHGISCAGPGSCVDVGNAGYYQLEGALTPALSPPELLYYPVVSCASETHCVVLGIGQSGLVAQTWNNGTWSTQPLPSGTGFYPDAISCPTTSFCGAAGGGAGAMILQNGTWTFAALSEEHMELRGISCPVAGSCIAVGARKLGPYYYAAEYVPAAASFSGTSASIMAVPEPSQAHPTEGISAALEAVSCASVSECVATGGVTSYYAEPSHELRATNGLIYTEKDGGWEPTVGSSQAYFTDVSCTAGGYCLADGFSTPHGGYAVVAWQRVDGAWSPDALPEASNPEAVGPVFCTDQKDCVLGEYSEEQNTVHTTVLSSASPYKIVVYTHKIHSFVQFRYNPEPAETTATCVSKGVICHTFGEFPAPGYGILQNPLATIFDAPAAITTTDGKGTWDYRIVYEVTKEQYNAALAYVDSQVALVNEGKLRYSMVKENCMAFVLAVAAKAGLTVPNAYAGGIPGLGLSTPDPEVLVSELEPRVGELFDGGYVEKGDGSTANGAPDPEPPPDPSSVTELPLQALSQPEALAGEFELQREAHALTAVSLKAGGTLSLGETGTAPGEALYAVDWGDGSEPERAALTTESAAGYVPSFTHTYSSAGTYRLRLIVLQGALEEYETTVTVGSGGESSASEQFTVPPAPTDWEYPYTVPLAEYAPLAGAPGPPVVDSVSAGAGSATVSFSGPSETGDSPITQYTVTALDATNGADGGQSASGTGSPITVSGLTPGDSYTFTVTASNAEGPGTPSEASNAVVPTTGSGSGQSAGSSTSASSSSGSGAVSSPAPVATAVTAAAKLGKVTVSGTTLHAALNCEASAAGTCSVRLQLTITETLKDGKPIALTAKAKHAKAQRTKRTILLASSTVSLPAGESKIVSLTLNAIGTQLLAKHKKLPVKLTLTETSTAKTATITSTITFTYKKPKRPSHRR